MFSSRKVSKDDVWEGTVLEKTRNMPDGSNMYHYVQVRLSDGETRKFRIDGDLWKSLEAGDRIVKVAGADPVRSQ